MFYKVFSIFVVLVLSRVTCEPPISQYGSPPISSYGTPNYNANNGHDHGDHGDHSEPKAYEFGYQVKDDYSGNNYNRREASDGNQVRGEYRVQLPDGRTQIVTYYADWQTGFHADVRYEGTASYPDQYNTQPSNQYGTPGFGGGNSGYSDGYHQGNNYNNNYNSAGATSSVSIKDYSTGNSAPYDTRNNYNGQHNNYDSYNSGNFVSKIGPTPVYGAP